MFKKWSLLALTALFLSGCSDFNINIPVTEEDLTREIAIREGYVEKFNIPLEDVQLITETEEKKVTNADGSTKMVSETEYELHAFLPYAYDNSNGVEVEFLSENVEVTSNNEVNTLDIWVDNYGDLMGVSRLNLTKAKFAEYLSLVKEENND